MKPDPGGPLSVCLGLVVVGLPVFAVGLMFAYGIWGYTLPLYDGAVVGLALFFIWAICGAIGTSLYGPK